MEPAYQHFRQEKDDFFGKHAHSPLTAEQRQSFNGLSYYPVNAALRFTLTPTEFDTKERLMMQTNTGEVREYERWGVVAFTVAGQPAQSTLFSTEHGFFVPFTDATSGSETYGAGRYLDLEPGTHLTDDGRWIVDFNEAYNPWCAYSHHYVCPFVPPENWLKAPVRAGDLRQQGAGLIPPSLSRQRFRG